MLFLGPVRETELLHHNQIIYETLGRRLKVDRWN
jgi:hypothetical protein